MFPSVGPLRQRLFSTDGDGNTGTEVRKNVVLCPFSSPTAASRLLDRVVFSYEQEVKATAPWHGDGLWWAGKRSRTWFNFGTGKGKKIFDCRSPQEAQLGFDD
jgi:hypothetical protein